MLRVLITLLVGFLALTFVRGIMGILSRGIAEAVRGAATQPRQPAATNPGGNSPSTFGGDLVKDPVCGTFVSAQSRFAKTAGGATHRFCSQECLDRFV